MGGKSSSQKEPTNSATFNTGTRYSSTQVASDVVETPEFVQQQRLLLDHYNRIAAEKRNQHTQQPFQVRYEYEYQRQREADQRQRLLEEEHKWKEAERQRRLLVEEHKQKEVVRQRRLLVEEHKRKEAERQRRLLEEERQRTEAERQRRLLEEERQQKEAERQQKLLEDERREKEQQQKRLEERRKKLLEEQHRQRRLQDECRQKMYNEQSFQKENSQQTCVEKDQHKSSEEHQGTSLDEESLKMFLKEEYQEKIPKEWEQKNYMKGIMKLYNLAEEHVQLSKTQGKHDIPGFLHSAVLRDSLAANWGPMPPDKTYVRVPVQEDTDEFRSVNNCFKATTQKRFVVDKIERVQNPFLLGCYLLKKLEMENMYGARNVEEKILFRGAFAKFIDKNCENNFNWRIYAVSKHNKYGEGFTLSHISYIANFSADKEATNKAMFLVRVLVSKVTDASENMEIPPLLNDRKLSNVLRFDTTKRRDGKMIVKFADNEFYPDYIIHYTVGPELEKKGDKVKNPMHESTMYDD
ncbi:hypothetical protein L9F63_022797 [Diploptera punctata]|uniref:Poly [ADP-ribose] polymerase n=1 Tax=Diploptera punctata TaxID=6984 RepID=A0AAD8EA74_DIPPU|nr:hypothetical protein L9F63_022797 [Diploptera punctata]